MDNSQTLDELLVIQSKQGDRRAMALLVKRWHPKIVRHAYGMTKDQAAAKDIAQETWLAVVKGMVNLRDPAVFKVWIYRIASNKCVSWVRSKQKQRRMAASQEGKYETLQNDDDRISKLKLALSNMGPRQRAILSMFYLEEHSMREISEVLGVPVGTVKSRLFHAREQLKKTYHEKYEKRRN